MSEELKGLMLSALNTQEGGDHYKKYPVQPIEYAMANGLNYCQANAIKYVTRYKDKNGAEDLRKAIHNIEILLEIEYGERHQRVRPEAATKDSEAEQGSKNPAFSSYPTATD